MTTAWLTENLARTKRMPDLEKFLSHGRPRSHTKPQTAEEQIAAWKTIFARREGAKKRSGR